MMITPEQIEQDKKLCEEATSGPWRANEWYGAEDPGWCAVGPIHEPVTDDGDDDPDGELHERAKLDSAFISRARTALPEYIAEVERLRAENEQLKNDLDRLAEPRILEFLTRAASDVLSRMDKAEAENQRLRAENESLRRGVREIKWRG